MTTIAQPRARVDVRSLLTRIEARLPVASHSALLSVVTASGPLEGEILVTGDEIMLVRQVPGVERFGAVLSRRSPKDFEHLQAALRKARRSRQLIGEALLELDVATQDQLRACLLDQILEAIQRLSRTLDAQPFDLLEDPVTTVPSTLLRFRPIEVWLHQQGTVPPDDAWARWMTNARSKDTSIYRFSRSSPDSGRPSLMAAKGGRLDEADALASLLTEVAPRLSRAIPRSSIFGWNSADRSVLALRGQGGFLGAVATTAEARARVLAQFMTLERGS